LKSSELRKLYLDFFASKSHEIKASSSLIPEDHSLLFTVAGMVPFKNYFLGKVPLVFTRATTCQKCIRTNDIDNVGRTRRHHTFFEMLGNFSFGDYFKEEAIAWAWEFLTEVIKLPKNRLYITVYKTDDTALGIWKNKMKVPEDRIFRMGEETNFWEMGTTGPCGYCSEIYFDLEGGDKGHVTAKDIEENDNRFLEIWNLVFTEFDKKADGTLGPLVQKNIDTGMGLERLAAVSQGVISNFESDLFMPIIKDVADRAKTVYGKDEKTNVSLRVIADHARGVTFLIGDGVLPSNEGRGYVLRRIIRRAVRHGRLLGIKEPFLHKVVPVVAHLMQDAYPEINQRKEYIMQIIKLEEEKFIETMDKGMDILNLEIEKVKASGSASFDGEAAFKLYDTYGFPIEITDEILREQNLSVDHDKFKACMENQRVMAKKAWKGMNSELTENVSAHILEPLAVTKFTGYETMGEEGCTVTALVKNKNRVEELVPGDEAFVILDKTPFYAESGGQTGDKGIFIAPNFSAEVTDTQKIDEIFIHTVKIKKGTLKDGMVLSAQVDRETRKATMKNHSATHLLQAALRLNLGLHVEQAGSSVGPERLRFDFTHFAQLTDEEIKTVESQVNTWVQEGFGVTTDIMDFEDAKNRGAMALFDEKYKGKVRMVSIGEVSVELCAGTHIKNSGEIGIFKIISAGSTAAGVRRIEAVTGKGAEKLFGEYDEFVRAMRSQLKASTLEEINERIKKLAADNKEMEKEISGLKKADILKNVDEYIGRAMDINGMKMITARFDGADKTAIRDLGDILKVKMKKGIALLVNVQDGKVSFLTVVSDDLTDKADASKIVKAAAAVCGGGGGGRKDMAEAGGKDPSKVDEAINKAVETVKAL
jgi:alanyl-tRNA synthetase